MSDERKLLEWAARAAGLNFDPTFIGKYGLRVASEHNQGEQYDWNPLEDDGQALRLANQLKMLVGIDGRFCEVMFGVGGYVKELAGRYNPDPDVRRAIVRAAAEIGRSMP